MENETYSHIDGKVSFGWVCPRCGMVNAPIAYSCQGYCTPKITDEKKHETIQQKSLGDALNEKIVELLMNFEIKTGIKLRNIYLGEKEMIIYNKWVDSFRMGSSQIQFFYDAKIHEVKEESYIGIG